MPNKDNKSTCPYHEMKGIGKTIMDESHKDALWTPAIVKHQREQEKRR